MGARNEPKVGPISDRQREPFGPLGTTVRGLFGERPGNRGFLGQKRVMVNSLVDELERTETPLGPGPVIGGSSFRLSNKASFPDGSSR
ncbi:hypothetical protein GWK47_008465 [Chionoecetes opilio]|uniref:Uncharacterized protein n=1 Tax=Chionoecetes opilio TaxID=41210 RepID=A0A8J4XZ93_CHIOP|nr:hypothetical protein GWK47_008465 [Chionoecetes opilio]